MKALLEAADIVEIDTVWIEAMLADRFVRFWRKVLVAAPSWILPSPAGWT
jgi:hypothetical protein